MKKANQPLIIAAGIVGAALVLGLALIFMLGGGTTETDTEPSRTENGDDRQPTEPAPDPQPDPDPEPEDPPGMNRDEQSGPIGVGDKLYPGLGNPGYDVLHYAIELDVDLPDNFISASILITAQATEDLETFNLDLSGLEVHSVAVDGHRASFSRSGHELTIRPSNQIAAGRQFEAEIHYSGSPEPIEDPGVPFSKLGWLHLEDYYKGGIIYTVNQPVGAMTWFPSNNHPSDKATYEIQIIVPGDVVAASNGLLIDETAVGNKTAYTWRMDSPMATYLAAVYIGDFERIDHGRLYEGGPLIRDYVFSFAPAATGQALSVTPEVIEFLEDKLGPYPFDAYGTIVIPTGLGFALENQTLSVHGQDTIYPGIIAHEAAHQWLGNSVTLDNWSDIWLNEGWATYLHLMFEAEYSSTDLDDMMDQIHGRLSAVGAGPPGSVGTQTLFDFDAVFLRGAATLHALRLHAGDEVFFEILRAHYDRSAGSTANTDEFLDIVNEFAGSEAVGLVESWLFDEAVPASF